jgi:hypothetical protein
MPGSQRGPGRNRRHSLRAVYAPSARPPAGCAPARPRTAPRARGLLERVVHGVPPVEAEALRRLAPHPAGTRFGAGAGRWGGAGGPLYFCHGSPEAAAPPDTPPAHPTCTAPGVSPRCRRCACPGTTRGRTPAGCRGRRGRPATRAPLSAARACGGWRSSCFLGGGAGRSGQGQGRHEGREIGRRTRRRQPPAQLPAAGAPWPLLPPPRRHLSNSISCSASFARSACSRPASVSSDSSVLPCGGRGGRRFAAAGGAWGRRRLAPAPALGSSAPHGPGLSLPPTRNPHLDAALLVPGRRAVAQHDDELAPHRARQRRRRPRARGPGGIAAVAAAAGRVERRPRRGRRRCGRACCRGGVARGRRAGWRRRAAASGAAVAGGDGAARLRGSARAQRRAPLFARRRRRRRPRGPVRVQHACGAGALAKATRSRSRQSWRCLGVVLGVKGARVRTTGIYRRDQNRADTVCTPHSPHPPTPRPLPAPWLSQSRRPASPCAQGCATSVPAPAGAQWAAARRGRAPCAPRRTAVPPPTTTRAPRPGAARRSRARASATRCKVRAAPLPAAGPPAARAASPQRRPPVPGRLLAAARRGLGARLAALATHPSPTPTPPSSRPAGRGPAEAHRARERAEGPRQFRRVSSRLGGWRAGG